MGGTTLLESQAKMQGLQDVQEALKTARTYLHLGVPVANVSASNANFAQEAVKLALGEVSKTIWKFANDLGRAARGAQLVSVTAKRESEGMEILQAQARTLVE